MVADQCKDAAIITVPQGEASKSFKILETVLRQMLDFGMGRGDLVVAVGGGVVGDLAGFAAEAARRGKVLAYPVCGENCSLTAAVPGPDGWETGLYGIRTPVLERSVLLEPEQLDLVLVPCTAFDADCFRVGMGKGYYDRYLPRCTKAAKIGIALEVQRVAHAAVDEHDQRLDAFVTERGLYTWT